MRSNVWEQFEKKHWSSEGHVPHWTSVFFCKKLLTGASHDTKIGCIRLVWAVAKRYKFSFLLCAGPLSRTVERAELRQTIIIRFFRDFSILIVGSCVSMRMRRVICTASRTDYTLLKTVMTKVHHVGKEPLKKKT